MSFIWSLSSSSPEVEEEVSSLLPFPVMTFAIFNVDDFLPESESDSDDSDDSSLGCGIFGFCLLLFPKNKRKIYKLIQTKLSQFIYFSLILSKREETKIKYFAP